MIATKVEVGEVKRAQKVGVEIGVEEHWLLIFSMRMWHLKWETEDSNSHGYYFLN